MDGKTNKAVFKDKILRTLVQLYPAPGFADRSKFLLEDLIESVISQQLSVKAADTIFARFKGLFISDSFPTPQDILSKENEVIRQAGLSYAKTTYIKSIAQALLDKRIVTEEIAFMSDEEVITTLSAIKGIGRWTAEMILIFTLNRPDVFSLGDLGLRKAIGKLYGITDKKEIIKLSETWKPYRSSACWYLWRSLENDV